MGTVKSDDWRITSDGGLMPKPRSVVVEGLTGSVSSLALIQSESPGQTEGTTPIPTENAVEGGCQPLHIEGSVVRIDAESSSSDENAFDGLGIA